MAHHRIRLTNKPSPNGFERILFALLPRLHRVVRKKRRGDCGERVPMRATKQRVTLESRHDLAKVKGCSECAKATGRCVWGYCIDSGWSGAPIRVGHGGSRGSDKLLARGLFFCFTSPV